MKERDIESELVRRVKAAGGVCRKVRWVGCRNAPDRFVMIPEDETPGAYRNPIFFFVELKRPGADLRPGQAREIGMMRECGIPVFMCSTFSELDALPI